MSALKKREKPARLDRPDGVFHKICWFHFTFPFLGEDVRTRREDVKKKHQHKFEGDWLNLAGLKLLLALFGPGSK